jgi:hypothetical protein
MVCLHTARTSARAISGEGGRGRLQREPERRRVPRQTAQLVRRVAI